MYSNRFAAVTFVCSAMVVSLAGCGSDASSDAAKTTATATVSASPTPTASKAPGIETKSADEIVRRAKAELLVTPSLTMTFDGTDGGDPMTGHLSADRKGDCVGEMGMGTHGHFEIIENSRTLWMKPDAAMWAFISGKKDAAGVAELFKGRYLKGSANDKSLKDMAGFCDLGSMTKEIVKSDSAEKLSKGPLTTLNGVKAIVVHSVGSDGAGDVYVATEGTPRFLKFQQTKGKDPITVTFSDFGKPVTVQPPAAENVIDMSKLAELGGS
ncbi:hypothetical protein LK07_10075 [Streptomyces pluripotens]|uniref:Lipoprotein n=1 Tax=Streptomyces pluripotens TaxID=1355015 RepID=A0A221NX20_9ACTN|nr:MULTISPECIES: hypothetical protein [Streptomyces]ARP70077.1 hypothetical protein LK06_008965 [Streptomyces pluripotens]ASN24338.1 hypothetical protein LK07_10075 [Streptomyces pluripotens]KIE25362.1 hypothetical protein LK08_20165 [Streptomyces sp. MUSC 125]MCH0561333.1 hypothetical protein [Streptomyces sp. MUM 16J]